MLLNKIFLSNVAKCIIAALHQITETVRSCAVQRCGRSAALHQITATVRSCAVQRCGRSAALRQITATVRSCAI